MKTIRRFNIFLSAILILCSCLLSTTLNAQEFDLNAIIKTQSKRDTSTLSAFIGFLAGFTASFVEPRLPKKFRKNIPALLKKELNKNKIKHDSTYFYLSSLLGNVVGSAAANCFKENSKKSLYISFEYNEE